MDFLCPPVINTSLVGGGGNLELDNSSFPLLVNGSQRTGTVNDTSEGKVQHPEQEDNWDYTDYTRKIAVPLLCTFGILGNVLNTIILSARIREGKLAKLTYSLYCLIFT